MRRRFFELHDDVEAPGRWHLATPVDSHGRKLDDWQFTNGRPSRITGRLKVPIEVEGRPLDFSEAGLGVAILHVRAATLFAELAPDDVQLLPVDIEGQSDQYQLLVATRLIRCIDEAASKVRLWTPEHGVPEMVGQYLGLDHLRIDAARVGTAKVFRPEGWDVALIVSEDLKEALERQGTTGTRFQEV
ncbi:imm11 family protein [Hyalangium rubrum]|uniref:Immunity MXAN-0049 protein domain-containing protein n=1 Tax=Hyalangium rubrum TaxID=3103134 RepID=A0ABU5H528_9BACT|nr:DUF1629 domain-containing protein [Hyalangium sp. s54d21]MDY7227185.1 hypothetical protein [Hyalangium sp. s54d21]